MDRRLVAAALVVATVVVVGYAALSLGWRMQHDVPIFVYLSWLIDTQGFVPYRDLFDLNLPGTYVAHIAIGHLFGYTDRAARVADLVLLAAISGFTWGTLRRFGTSCGWFASLAFALWYLSHGPEMSLQRDYLAVLPISAAICVALGAEWPARVRAVLVGVLLGVAATIKPYALVGWPWLVVWLTYDACATTRQGGGFLPALLRITTAAAVGLALPLALTGGYLIATGAWPAFASIVANYWPLYGAINGQLGVLPDGERSAFLAAAFPREVLEPNTWALVLVALGALPALGLQSGLLPVDRRRVVALAGLVAVYSLYPLAGGKFWPYHTLPFVYVTCLAAGLCARPLSMAMTGRVTGGARLVRHGAAVAAIVFLFWQAYPSGVFRQQLLGGTLKPPKGGAPDQIAAYLHGQLRPGDRVQPLDWTGGAVHGMFEARAVLATPYVYDVQFHHALSTPYVQSLRADFLQRLAARPPRFVIDVVDKPSVWGFDTSRDFPALTAWLQRDYAPVVDDARYTLYERRPGLP